MHKLINRKLNLFGGGMMAERIHGLDSLRGLAALTVVVHHTLITLPILYAPYSATALQGYDQAIASSSVLRALIYSPLHLLWGGSEAVVLFFVLSGFVLALPFLEGEAPRYKDYLVKRVCRIYLPYLFAVSLSVALMILLSRNGIPGLSSWFNKMWSEPVTAYTIADQLLMLGNTTHNVNTVTWSLVHEMRVSLVFPLVVLFVRRRSWWFVLLAAGVASVGVSVVNKAYPLPVNLNTTIHYGALFVVGAVAARFRHSISDIVRRVKPATRVAVLILAGFLLNWRWQLAGAPFIFTNGFVSDWAVAAGSVGIIALTLAARPTSGVLAHPWALWLGKVSYSLYLIHIPVLLTLAYSLGGLLPLPAVLALTPVASLLLAGLTHRFVELPAIRLGRRMSSGGQPRTSIPA